MNLPVFGLDEITRAVDPAAVLDAVRQTLIAHTHGRTTVPPPMHLEFADADGDSHVKAGYIHGAKDFTVKVASSFYRNPAIGLPSNQGLVCVFDARTGQARAVLDDGGMLTGWRTAAAGALVTDALAGSGVESVGVIGTGQQAELQIAWLAKLRTLPEVRVTGRTEARAADLCERLARHGIPARPAPLAETAGSSVVITATAATAPVLAAEQVSAGAHITAIGADMPHKNELPPELFRRAALIVTDDHRQCLEHGDLAHAVRAGTVEDSSDISIGRVLEDPAAWLTSGISIADLTGIGALDAAVAAVVVDALLG
ncbi:ornithine cyclodeaminase family protein [Nakamurella silvestris]|nr:ornithine cyclodeaminase family protein [Nakamurella silvestris]